MSSDPRDRAALQQPLEPQASRRELRWHLQQILAWLGINEGGFRAATGQWPGQLTEAELRAWLAWFSADPEHLPAMPVQPALMATPAPASPMPSAPPSRDDSPAVDAPSAPARRRGPPRQEPAPAQPASPVPSAPPSRDDSPAVDAPSAPSAPARRREPLRQEPAPVRRREPLRQEPAPVRRREPLRQEPTPAQPAEPEAPHGLTAEEHAFIEELRRGTTVQRAARQVGVSVQRLYLRRRLNAELDAAWQAALAERDASQPSDEPAPREGEEG